MRIRNGVAAFLIMFLIIISWLITSFQLVIYGDPKYQFYQSEYEKYGVTEALDMRMEDVMAVTEYMMDYLIGKEDVLSIETDVDGKTQDFFNEQDRLHMEDVKNLFLGGLRIRTICLIAAALCLAFLICGEKDWKQLIRKAYFYALGVFVVLILLLLISFFVDFTASFTVFHEIFFTNDLWMFDPATDYMIRMLPEGFFYDMVMRIGLVFCGGLVFLMVMMILWGRCEKWRRNKKKL